VQVLPGVTSAGSDLSAQVSLRGGSPDQTMLSIDGVPIFNPYHFSGWLSSVNEDFVSEVDLYRSNYPPMFGGYVSGAINVQSKDGNREHVKGSAALNITSGHGYVEGPLGNGTFILAARRMWLDLFWNLLTPQGIPYSFYDVFGKYSFRLGEKNLIGISAFLSKDDLDPFDPRGLISKDVRDYPSWGNIVTKARIEHFVNNDLSFTTEAHLSKSFLAADGSAQYEDTQFDSPLKKIVISNGMREAGFGIGLRSRLSSHNIVVGLGLKSINFDYSWDIHWVGFRDPIGLFFPKAAQFFDGAPDTYSYRANTSILSGYVIDSAELFESVYASVGLRFDRFSHTDDFLLSPYVALKYSLDESLSISAAVGKYFQHTYALKENKAKDLIFSPYSIVFLSSKRGEFAESRQYSVGLELNDFMAGISIRLDGYLHSNQNLASTSVLDSTPSFENGKSLGLDFLLSGSLDAVKGWVAYSLSQSTKRSPQHTYHANADRPHSLKVLCEYKIADWLSFSAFWIYASGVPYTPVAGRFATVTTDGRFEWRPIYGSKNGARSRASHRLDLGVSSMFVWGEALIVPYVQVFNAYNSPNSFFSEWVEDGVRETRSSSILPSVGVKVEF